MTQRLLNLLKSILTALVSTMGGLLVLEAGIRLSGIDRPDVKLALVGSEAPTSAYHPRLGWTNLPDSAGWLRWPGSGRAFHLTTNRQGFRFSRDFTIRQNRAHRVALLGDSQVFGFVVGDDEHLGAILDRELPNAETYPFGVPGYGPTQELLLLEETVLDYAPDVVVAVMFLQNDLNDETESIGYGFLAKPYLLHEAGGWTIANVPVPLPVIPSPPGSRSFVQADPELFALSAIYRFTLFRSVATPALADTLTRLGLTTAQSIAVHDGPNGRPDAGFRRADGKEPACNVVAQCPFKNWLDGLPAAVEAYERMAEACRRHDARFVALIAPAPVELAWRKFGLTDAVVTALRAKGIDTLPLVDAFMRFLNPMDLIAPDQHWNPEGTRVVADVVEQHLQSLLTPSEDAAGRRASDRGHPSDPALR